MYSEHPEVGAGLGVLGGVADPPTVGAGEGVHLGGIGVNAPGGALEGGDIVGGPQVRVAKLIHEHIGPRAILNLGQRQAG